MGNSQHPWGTPAQLEQAYVLSQLRTAFSCCDAVAGYPGLRKPIAPISFESLLDPCGQTDVPINGERAVEVAAWLAETVLLRLEWTGGHSLEVLSIEVEQGKWIYLLAEGGGMLLLGGADAPNPSDAHMNFLDAFVGTNGEEFRVPLIVGVPESVWMLGQDDFDWAHRLFLRAMLIAADDFGEGVWEPVFQETAARVDAAGIKGWRNLREEALRVYLNERMKS